MTFQRVSLAVGVYPLHYPHNARRFLCTRAQSGRLASVQAGGENALSLARFADWHASRASDGRDRRVVGMAVMLYLWVGSLMAAAGLAGLGFIAYVFAREVGHDLAEYERNRRH